jgi:hypothetical protein
MKTKTFLSVLLSFVSLAVFAQNPILRGPGTTNTPAAWTNIARLTVLTPGVSNQWRTEITGATGSLATALSASLAQTNLPPIGQSALSLSGTNCTVDVSAVNLSTNVFFLTLTTNVYFAQPSNLQAGKSFKVLLLHNGTAGWTTTWNSTYWLPGPLGLVPSASTAANALDVMECLVGPYATNVLFTLTTDFR